MPGLFETADKIARRAGLQQAPKLYRFADDGMNAYALGSPKASTVTLTDGLLRGLHPAEITGILAHEIAHICSGDSRVMAFAGSLQKTIAAVAPSALALARPAKPTTPLRPFEVLLGYAPTLAQLLYLGLSRTREHDADAMALQLTDNPQALVAALAKLEQHHNGSFAMRAMAPREDVSHYFNSHPRTSDRVGKLLHLAG
jgi:heat shock protein HtpX